jgi:tetratricopeptide (TPR) repeat protein
MISPRFILVLLAGLALAGIAVPASAQNSQAKPEVDPDRVVDTYKYTPPGVLKSVEVGNYYLKKKKYNAALSRFQEAVHEDSAYAPAYLGLGKVYEKIGLKQKALDAYKKYLDALPSQRDALNAKDAQRAVERLEEQIKTKGPQNRSRASRAEPPPPSH